MLITYIYFSFLNLAFIYFKESQTMNSDNTLDNNNLDLQNPELSEEKEHHEKKPGFFGKLINKVSDMGEKFLEVITGEEFKDRKLIDTGEH